MFRPEMLESMGLPEDLRVYGWGLSLERPTMIKHADLSICAEAPRLILITGMASTTSESS